MTKISQGNSANVEYERSKASAWTDIVDSTKDEVMPDAGAKFDSEKKKKKLFSVTKKLEKSDNVYRLGGVDLNRGGQRKNGTLARPKKIKKFFFQLGLSHSLS